MGDELRVDAEGRALLLGAARRSIGAGVGRAHAAEFAGAGFPAQLRKHRSSFVTVTVAGDLRGCCGTLDAERPLVEDVWSNAFASAFLDSRFAPLSTAELDRIDLEISVLSLLSPLSVTTERELVATLRTGHDGLVLRFGPHRATFIPRVWAGVENDGEEFVRRLKLKAGLPADFWSGRMAWLTFGAQSFGMPGAA